MALANTSSRLIRISARNSYQRSFWGGWRPCWAGKPRGCRSSRLAWTSRTLHRHHTAIEMRCAWSSGASPRPYGATHISAPGTTYSYSRIGEPISSNRGYGRQRRPLTKRWESLPSLKVHTSSTDRRQAGRSPWRQSPSTEWSSAPRSAVMQYSSVILSIHRTYRTIVMDVGWVSLSHMPLTVRRSASLQLDIMSSVTGL